MSCLGVHFALTEEEVRTLKAIRNERDRLNHLKEVIEEQYFENSPEWLAQSDKSWDAMHRALADGELTWNGGEYPLSHVVLGGELLYSRADYIMSLKSAAQVRDIAGAVASVTEAEFRGRYFAIGRSYEFGTREDDCQYTWEYFQHVRDLLSRAADAGRPVLFTADQ